MKKAYSYIRFSSPEQAKGRSYERQRDQCAKWCAENGYQLAESNEYSFFDRGVSAFTGQHAHVGELARFLSLVNDGTIEAGSTLIVESLDRLGREHVKQALPRFMDLLDKGINIVTLLDGKTYTKEYTPIDLMLSILIMSRAYEESSTKSKRIVDVWNYKHEQAQTNLTPLGNTAPLWLDFVPRADAPNSKEAIRQGTYVVNATRAAVVKRIFQMSIDGYGRDVIAKTLNKEGIESFKGKTWGISSVQRILRNKAVLGFYQPMRKKQPVGEPVARYFDPIIDEETFYQAQEATNARRLARATKQSGRFQIWQGIAKCYKCGAAMHFVDKGKPPKGRTYLVCANKRKALCDTQSVREGMSEDVFREILAKVDSLPLIQDSHAKIEKELSALEGKIAEQQEQYDDLKQALTVRYSKALDDSAYKVERKLEASVTRREELKAALAADRIVDREHFFERLDLQSYEGRYRANALLKRLGITVWITGGSEPVYIVRGHQLIEYPGRHAGEKISFGERKPLLQIVCRENEIVVIPLTADQRTKFKEQDADGRDGKTIDNWLASLGLVSGKPPHAEAE